MSGITRYPGGRRTIELRFTRVGFKRFEKLQKVTGMKVASKVVAQAINRFNWYLHLASLHLDVFAQLGNFIERFDFNVTTDDTLMANRKGLRVAYIVEVHIDESAYQRLQDLCDRANVPDTELFRMALLFYEWYVLKLGTGYQVMYGRLKDVEPKIVQKI